MKEKQKNIKLKKRGQSRGTENKNFGQNKKKMKKYRTQNKH